MRIAAGLGLVSAVATLVLAGAAAEAKTMPPKPIMKVRSAAVMVVRTPHALRLCATGSVSSTGWTRPMLNPVIYVQAPPDGIYDFTFVATPPSGIVLQRITSIRATRLWANPPKGVKGIRVHGASNSVVARIGSLPTTCLVAGRR